MATKPTEPPELGRRERDVRASRPYLLSRGTARATVRRVVAIAVLAGLDALGLALGLYAALVLRSIVFGDPIFWNLLWQAGPADWLPFLVPITWLVFWQAGLYAGRERRAGAGKSRLVDRARRAIMLAFGWGTNYDFTTSGLIPTACVTSALAIGLLRAAYESLTLELQRLLHVRRRVLLVGEGSHLESLERVLTSPRRAHAYELVGSFAPGQDGPLEARLAQVRPDEIVLSEGGFDEETVFELVETAHRTGVRVRIAPKTTELLLQRGEYVPGQGMPLFELRPPVLAGCRLGGQEGVRPRRQLRGRAPRACRSGS